MEFFDYSDWHEVQDYFPKAYSELIGTDEQNLICDMSGVPKEYFEDEDTKWSDYHLFDFFDERGVKTIIDVIPESGKFFFKHLTRKVFFRSQNNYTKRNNCAGDAFKRSFKLLEETLNNLTNKKEHNHN